jgi:hypothetical protein
MAKDHKKMKFKLLVGSNLAMKMSRRNLVIAGAAAAMIAAGFFFYMNLSNPPESKAALQARIIETKPYQSELEVKKQDVTPAEKQPGTHDHPEIENKRKAVAITE